jgi:heme-degrading monooxygenase HmoA
MSVVEILTFTLATGTDTAAFLEADRRVQTELIPNQPGFLRRTTARQGDEWLVVVLWASQQHATDFDEVARDHPVQAEFARQLEWSSVMMHRYDTLD